MTSSEIIEQLKSLGNDSIKNTLIKHGAREPFYGVKVEDLKKIQKKVKKNYELSKELYDTGISDAMYLAGLIADETKMTKDDLQHWADKAYWYMLSEFTVPWIAAESQFGLELAMEWIESGRENIAAGGWHTLGMLISLKTDWDEDINFINSLCERIFKDIHGAPNRVRYAMNTFIISVGIYIPALTDYAIALTEKIGKVQVNMGKTACKVPYGPEYIRNAYDKGRGGKKRKQARC